MKTIGCYQDNKFIGYWHASVGIIKHMILLYKDEKQLKIDIEEAKAFFFMRKVAIEVVIIQVSIDKTKK